MGTESQTEVSLTCPDQTMPSEELSQWKETCTWSPTATLADASPDRPRRLDRDAAADDAPDFSTRPTTSTLPDDDDEEEEEEEPPFPLSLSSRSCLCFFPLGSYRLWTADSIGVALLATDDDLPTHFSCFDFPRPALFTLVHTHPHSHSHSRSYSRSHSSIPFHRPTAMSPTYTELHGLKRADIQKLCKTLAIKGANQKTEALISLILQHYANGEPTASQDAHAPPTALSSAESSSSGAAGEGIASAKTGSNGSSNSCPIGSSIGRSNSRLLQPTASSRAKKMSRQAVSLKPSAIHSARSKREAEQPTETALCADQEELAMAEIQTDRLRDEPDGRTSSDEAMADETVRVEAARPDVHARRNEDRSDAATTAPTSVSTPEPVKPNEAVEPTRPAAASVCTCMRSVSAHPSELSTGLSSIRDSLAELTARVDDLPTREEAELNKRSVYDALACTDATVEFIGAEVMVFGRAASRAERQSVTKADVEAMVDRLVESRLKQIELSFADRLRAAEDRLTALLSETRASWPETIRLSDMHPSQTSQTSQTEQVLGKRTRNTMDMLLSVPSASTVTGSSISKDIPNITLSGFASPERSSRATPSRAALGAALGVADVDDHRQKRPRIVSLAVSEMDAGDVEGLLVDVSVETSTDDIQLDGLTTEPSIASAATVTAATAAVLRRSGAEPGSPVVPLSSPTRPDIALSGNDDGEMSLSTRQAVVTSPASSAPGSQPDGSSSHSTLTPSGGRTVRSLLPPVPVGGPFWMSPMAPSRQLYRPTSGSKKRVVGGTANGAPDEAADGLVKEAAIPFARSPMRTLNTRLGTDKNERPAPPTPPGPKTMFGTEKETFGQFFSDEMTPWMP